MGLKDYENYKLYPESPQFGLFLKKVFTIHKGIDKITVEVSSDTLINLAKYLLLDGNNEQTFGSILNRPVFKHTRAREEILFIKCYLELSDGKIKEFIIVTNEFSFFKRFDCYSREKHNKLITYYDNLIALNIIKNQIEFSNNKYDIYLKLYDFEIEKMKNAKLYVSDENKMNENEIKKFESAKVRISNVTHFNKHLWCHIFLNPILIYNGLAPNGEPQILRRNINLGDIKDINSECYYDNKPHINPIYLR